MEDEWEYTPCMICEDNEANIESRTVAKSGDEDHLLCEEREEKLKTKFKCQLTSCSSLTNGSQYCGRRCMMEHIDLLNKK